MSDNLINKSIDWSINALSRSNNDIKSPNWLFRLLIVCIFFIIYVYFLICIQKIIPVVYNKCRNKQKDNLEIDKIIAKHKKNCKTDFFKRRKLRV